MQQHWEFTAYLLNSGTRWGWTCTDGATGRTVESMLTFPSYRAAVANAATCGFDHARHRYVLAAIEPSLPPNRHRMMSKLPAWPPGIAVV